MPNDEKPKSKYECLAEAVGNSGIALPPIKPGTEVSERAIPGMTEIYIDRDGNLAGRPFPPAEYSDFKYKGVDDRDHTVTVYDGVTPNEGRFTALSLHQTGVGSDQGSDYTGFRTDKDPAEDFAPGKTTDGIKLPKQGTISESVGKILKCRDPGIS